MTSWVAAAFLVAGLVGLLASERPERRNLRLAAFAALLIGTALWLTTGFGAAHV